MLIIGIVLVLGINIRTTSFSNEMIGIHLDNKFYLYKCFGKNLNDQLKIDVSEGETLLHIITHELFTTH